MKKFSYIVQDATGIHARPAGLLVKAAKVLDSTVALENAAGKSAVATKLMAVMGLGIKQGICLANGVGVIDSDYRGEIAVGLVNLSQETYTIRPGDRIAQLMVTTVVQPEVTITDVLDETERGTGGLGSTGR